MVSASVLLTGIPAISHQGVRVEGRIVQLANRIQKNHSSASQTGNNLAPSIATLAAATIDLLEAARAGFDVERAAPDDIQSFTRIYRAISLKPGSDCRSPVIRAICQRQAMD